MSGTARSWSSVCADCALYRTAQCPPVAGQRRPDDCIAAVCARFTPGAPGKPGGEAEEKKP